jgi:polar amino acid transport system substrate-binding protein
VGLRALDFRRKTALSQAELPGKPDPLNSIRLCALLVLALLYHPALAEEPASDRTLTIAIESEQARPFEYVDETGRATGFHVEVEREVAERLGWSVRFLRVPWVRATEMLKSGEAEAATYMVETPERDQFAIFAPGNVLHLIHLSMYINREDEGRIRWEPPLEAMLARWRVGIARGYYYPDSVRDLLKPGETVDNRARTWVMLMRMLLARHVDIAFTAYDPIEQLRTELPDIDSRIVPLAGAPAIDTPVYLAFTRRNDGPRKAEAFAAAYAAWRQTDEYRALVARFGTAVSLGVDSLRSE